MNSWSEGLHEVEDWCERNLRFSESWFDRLKRLIEYGAGAGKEVASHLERLTPGCRSICLFFPHLCNAK